MRKTLSALLFLAVLPGLLHANEQQFAFALPELEGRITLGVFDAGGKLVRTLFVAASENDFKIGLNGLIATWDGKSDTGQPVTPGKYRIRGYLVGHDVKAEGVAYHFNDWIESDESPPISGLGAIIPSSGDSFLVFGYTPSRDAREPAVPIFGHFDEADGLQTLLTLPPGSSFLAADSNRLAAATGGQLALYDFKNPTPPLLTTTAFSLATFWDNHLYLQAAAPDTQQLSIFDLALTTLTESRKIPSPARFLGLDASPTALLAWNATSIWHWNGKDFIVVPLKELPPNFTLSAGPDQTLWLAAKHADDVIVRQHAFDGELLREMKISEPLAEVVQIFASKTALSFYLLLRSQHGNHQTLRAYRPANTPSPLPATEGTTQVDWETFLDKTIENSRRFGFLNGQLVANAGETLQTTEAKLRLPATTLQTKGAALTVHATSDHAGIWLRTTDGLPLILLAPRRHADRLILKPGPAPDTLHIFAGDNVVVAEYSLTGLENIAPLEAGEIEIP